MCTYTYGSKSKRLRSGSGKKEKRKEESKLEDCASGARSEISGQREEKERERDGLVSVVYGLWTLVRRHLRYPD